MATNPQKKKTTQDDEKAKADKELAVQTSLSKIKRKFLVMSGKGGVGKTSVSVNLALSLARKGYKVGLMDVDIHGPDVPRMLGMKGLLEGAPGNKLLPIQYSQCLSFVSIESMMSDKDSAVIWRGPMKHSAIQQFIGDVQWGALDCLIIDSPPGTGDEPLTVAQTIPDAQAIIVTTPQEVSLADVRKSINFCRRVDMKIFGIIENMSGFVCPHCKKMISLFGQGGGKRTALAANLQLLGEIPFDLKMVSCGDKGISFQKAYQDTEAAKTFGKIADNIRIGEAVGVMQ